MDTLSELKPIESPPPRINDATETDSVSPPVKLTLFYRSWVLGLISFTSSLIGMYHTIAATLFPLDAELKGASRKEIGAIFGCLMVAMGIASLALPLTLKPSQIKPAYCAGVVVIGASFTAFGSIGFMPIANYAYTALCCVVMSFVGLCCALVYVMATPIKIATFPADFSKAFAVAEVAFGLGQAAGPAIGSILYMVGGYALPFIAIGVTTILCGLLSLTIRTSSNVGRVSSTREQHNTSAITFGFFVGIPYVWILILCQTCTVWIHGFSYSFSALYMKHQLELETESRIALVFLVSSAGFIITSFVAGILSDRGFAGKLVFLTVAGVPVILALFYLPIIFEHLRSFWWASLLQTLVNSVFAATYIPFFFVMRKNCLIALQRRNLKVTQEDEKAMELYISGIFQLSRNLGKAFGTFICGGIVADLLSDGNTVMANFSLSLVMSALCIVLLLRTPTWNI